MAKSQTQSTSEVTQYSQPIQRCLKNEFRIFYHNVSGIKSQLDQIRAAILTSDYNIIVLTETWLNSDIKDCELFDDRWDVYRCDRSDILDHRNGGGVLIAVKKSLINERVYLNLDGVEALITRIKINDRWIYLNVVYLPPSSDVEKFEQYSNMLTQLLSSLEVKDDVIVFGDFNLARITWTPDADNCIIMNPSNVNCVKCNVLLNIMSDLGLFQLSNVTNNFGNVLDLVFSSIIDDISLNRASHVIKKDSVAHKALEVNFMIDTCKENNISDEIEFYYDYVNANFNQINEYLSLVEWGFGDDLNLNLSKFYDIIQETIQRYVPCKKRRTRNSTPWLTKEIRTLRNTKNRAFKKFRETGLMIHYDYFCLLRDQFNDVNEIAYKNYTRQIGNNLKNHPKKFWKLINECRRENNYPKTMRYEGVTANDNESKCNLFATFLQSVYVNHNLRPVNMSNSVNNPLFEIISIIPSETEVLLELQQLDKNKGPGPDLLPNAFLKSVSSVIYKPLHNLFKSSIMTGYFPEIWKNSYVVPIYKSGNKADITNYRGISILSAIPKLFEKLICDKLINYYLRYVHDSQHGFVKGRSTDTNLMIFMNYVVTSMENKKQVDVIYTDFSKAFDRVNHRLLLFKLERMGTPFIFLKWLKSYLSNRKQNVKIDGCLSRDILVYSGVPQGSHLGPILFALFINDLTDLLDNCMFLLYADDLKFFTEINTIEDAILMQENFEKIFEWCTNNDMSLNVNKCNYISFCRRKSPICFDYGINDEKIIKQRVVKDLGILMDEKLTMQEHIDASVRRARRCLGFVKRQAKQFDDPYVTKSLYCALVRPILEYGCIIWDPYTKQQITELESVQKQFLIFALKGLGWNDGYRLPPYRDRLMLLGMKELAQRRKILSAVFMYKLVKNIMNVPVLREKLIVNSSRYETRNRPNFMLPLHSTNYGKNEPFSKLIKIFNEYEELYNNSNSVVSFKTKIRQIL